MARRTPSEVYQALLAAGFPPASAVTMTAIAGAESSWDDAAVGDQRLQDNTWGPSYGLFQIRTLKRDTGKGTSRDLLKLTGDVGAQAAAAWEISKHGADYTPWTVYNTGRYRDFLGQVTGAAGGAAGAVVGGIVGAIPKPSLDVGGVLDSTRDLAIEAVAVLFGLGLVVVGAARLVGGRLRRRTAEVAEVIT